MKRLLFLVVLVVIKAENESGFKPMPLQSWNEATYLNYIKNMAMFPKAIPMSRQEFDVTTSSKVGNGFDFGNFDQKFNSFDTYQNQNFMNQHTQSQNLPAFGNTASTGNPYNTQSYNLGGAVHNLQNSGQASVQNQNLGLPQLNINLKDFGGLQEQQPVGAFGGVLNQNHQIFGGSAPAINLQPTPFPNVQVNTVTPAVNSDVISLLQNQQKKNQIYASSSYGISSGNPLQTPSNAQQDEILKLMKQLLAKIDGQTSTVKPSTQTKPEYEFKLTVPKHVRGNSAYSTKGKESIKSNNFKQFDFGSSVKINNNSIKKLPEFNQHFDENDYHFHSPPTSFVNFHSHPTNFRLPVKHSQKFNNHHHHTKNAPNPFQIGFEYPPTYRKQSHRSAKSRRPMKKPAYRFKLVKT